MIRAPLALAVLLLAGLLAGGCGDGKTSSTSQPPAADGPGAHGSDTPSAAVSGMLALAEAGNWEAYVTTYYGEQGKMTKPAEQIPQIAKRVRKIGPQLIEMLRACVDQKPRLNAHGTVATYPNGMKLYRDHGTWGFHL